MRRLQKQALKTEAKSTSYGRERAYKDWKRASANIRVAAEQQGQGVEQDGGAEPQLFYSDRTTRRPAYDEEAEADGSSDEEDFDSWAGWNSDDSDFEEGTTPAERRTSAVPTGASTKIMKLPVGSCTHNTDRRGRPCD